MCNNLKCFKCGVMYCCPHCSGMAVIKDGKTAAGKQGKQRYFF